ncbi:MAG: hypothetical protein IJV31_12280 [Clostridia bacterium]|nr:hypothetical protein [Clostridia bacterium]
MEKPWKITLSDGTEIKDLRKNGNNFVSETEITENDFKGKLSKVIIEGKEDGQKVKEEYEHMELVQVVQYEDGYYFILRELSERELKDEKIQSNLDYLAMMVDVDLEEV